MEVEVSEAEVSKVSLQAESDEPVAQLAPVPVQKRLGSELEGRKRFKLTLGLRDLDSTFFTSNIRSFRGH